MNSKSTAWTRAGAAAVGAAAAGCVVEPPVGSAREVMSWATMAAGDAGPLAVWAAVETGAGCVGRSAAVWAVAEDEQARLVANVALVVVGGVELPVGAAGGRALVCLVSGAAHGKDVFGGSVGVHALHAG